MEGSHFGFADTFGVGMHAPEPSAKNTPAPNENRADNTTKARDRGPRVTLQMIAERLHVSIATVSLALRNSPLVAETTKYNVQRVAAELGYASSRPASRNGRGELLALAMSNLADPAAAAFLGAVEEATCAHGRSLAVSAFGDDSEDQARALTLLQKCRPDGLILRPSREGHTPDPERDADWSLPIVQVVVNGGDGARRADRDAVGCDEGQAMRLAVEHLLDLGHRRIALIGGDAGAYAWRREGYRQTLARHDLPSDTALIVDGPANAATGHAGIASLMALEEPPTAFVCVTERVATGALIALARRGHEPGRMSR